MALFLTGMINDTAHTANGPGETRFYQTEKEGREGADTQRRERRERRGGGSSLRVWHCCVSVFEQGTECLLQRSGTALTRIYPRGSMRVINRREEEESGGRTCGWRS